MNKAAEELCIAPSSVTQHIRNLEDFVGADLLIRQANAISLNSRGKEYAKKVRLAFDTIHSATGEIFEESNSDPIWISCVPTLSGAWLARQIAKLAAEFPKHTIRCDFSPTPIDFDIEEIDIAIRYGPGEYPGTITELLHTDKLAPVCTPTTAERIKRPEDLIKMTRLDSFEGAPDGRSLWMYWASHAISDEFVNRLEGSQQWFLQSSLFSAEILKETSAVAVLEHSVVRDQLESGELLAPVGLWTPAPYGYHIVTSTRRPLRPVTKRLKALLKDSVKERFNEHV